MTIGGNRRPFGEMFKLTLLFLANPHKIWKEGRLEHKRAVLKLTFADRLTYDRETGFQTPEFSSIFRMLGDKNALDFQMAARSERFSNLPD